MSRKNRRISRKIEKKAQSIKKAIKKIKMPLEDEFDKQVKKTLNNKTVEERNKTSTKLKKPNIVKKVIKSVAKKIIPGGAIVGALTPKKMGDATLRSTDKPFVPKKKKK